MIVTVGAALTPRTHENSEGSANGWIALMIMTIGHILIVMVPVTGNDSYDM